MITVVQTINNLPTTFFYATCTALSTAFRALRPPAGSPALLCASADVLGSLSPNSKEPTCGGWQVGSRCGGGLGGLFVPLGVLSLVVLVVALRAEFSP